MEMGKIPYDAGTSDFVDWFKLKLSIKQKSIDSVDELSISSLPIGYRHIELQVYCQFQDSLSII